MDIVNFENRWVYKGSMNEPPCEQFVYWNIINGLYPFKIEEFAKFKSLMEKQSHILGTTYSNMRQLQVVVDQTVQYIGAQYLQLSMAIIVLTALTCF